MHCMTEITDPYLYPETDMLENLRGIRDVDKLARFEGRSAARRILELEHAPVKGEFNTPHLKAIHRHIFQDVFAWAGEFRTVNISKGGGFARELSYRAACGIDGDYGVVFAVMLLRLHSTFFIGEFA